MPDKPFVTVEQHICIVCGTYFDTGTVLLNQHMSAVFDDKTATRYGLCPAHNKLHEDDYVAFVAVDPDRCPSVNHAIDPREAYRTGDIAHIKRDVAIQITDASRYQLKFPVIFIDDARMLELKTFIANDNEDSSIN